MVWLISPYQVESLIPVSLPGFDPFYIRYFLHNSLGNGTDISRDRDHVEALFKTSFGLNALGAYLPSAI